MGTMIRCESEYFLLQREDQPAALAALKDHLRECPGDFRLNGELLADDLVTAFGIGNWYTEVDEHGDIVALGYAGDKYPPDATDDFPMPLFEAIAPFVRYGKFFRWIEGDDAVMSHVLGRGRNVYYRREPGVRLVQVGEPPVVRPGETAVVGFRLHGYGMDEGTVKIGTAHSTQVNSQFDSDQVNVYGTGRVRLTPVPGAADPVAFYVCMELDGVDLGDGSIKIRVASPPEESDAIHDVVAAESSLDNWNGGSSAVMAQDLPAAHEALRRYAARHAEQPGASFLRDVLKAPDIQSALKAAYLETRFSDEGHLQGFRFVGSKLPGYERYLWGLFASMRGIIRQDPWFRLAYAHAPARWVVFSYEWGEPSRHIWDR